jgi:hypothetical protein
MATLPSQHPSLSLHLADTALTPIITSAHSQPQLEALTSLTSAALTSHATLLRLGLGKPQRIMVEHGTGPVVLHSFLDPESAAAGTSSASGTNPNHNPSHGNTTSPNNPGTHHPTDSINAHTNGETAAAAAANENGEVTATSNGNGTGRGPVVGTGNGNGKALAATAAEEEVEDDTVGAPLLVGLVVAESADDALEARRAAARLEKVGREFQREWIVEERRDVMSDGAE